MFEFDFARRNATEDVPYSAIFHADRIGSAVNGNRRIDDFVHPPGATEALLHAVGNVRELCHLAGELLQQASEYNEPTTQSQTVLCDQPTAVGEQDDQVDLR